MSDGAVQTETVTISDTLMIVRITLAIHTRASPLQKMCALALLACSPSSLGRFGQSTLQTDKALLNSLSISRG